MAIHAGDSRIYVTSSSSNGQRLKNISRDDTLAARIHEMRGVSFTEAKEIPYSEGLAQFVGIGQGLQPQIMGSSDFHGVTSVLIASDGLYGSIETTLEQYVANAPGEKELVQRLLHASRWTGGSDNASLIFCSDLRAALASRATASFPRLELWDAFGKLDLVLSESLTSVPM